MPSLILYSTLGCHLCDEAEAILNLLKENAFDIRWQRVEIADSDELIEQYGIRIPVLRIDEKDLEIGWPFSAEDVVRFIESAAG